MTSKSRRSRNGKRKSDLRTSKSDSSDRTSRRDSLNKRQDDNEAVSLSDRDSTPNPLSPPSIRKNSTNDRSNPSRRDLPAVQKNSPKAPVSPAENSNDNQDLGENNISTEDTEQQLKVLQHFSKPSPFLKGRRTEIRDMLGTLFVTLGSSFESAQVAKKSLYALKESKLQQLNASLKAVLKSDRNSAQELLFLLSNDNPVRTLLLQNPEAFRTLLASIPNTQENLTLLEPMSEALHPLQNANELLQVLHDKQLELLDHLSLNASLQTVLNGGQDSAQELLFILSSDNSIRTTLLKDPKGFQALLDKIPNTQDSYTAIDRIEDVLMGLPNLGFKQGTSPLNAIFLEKKDKILAAIRTGIVPKAKLSPDQHTAAAKLAQEKITKAEELETAANQAREKVLPEGTDTRESLEKAVAKLEAAAKKARAEADAQPFKLSVQYAQAASNQDTNIVESVASVLSDQQKRAQVLQEVLWANHLQPIAAACKKFKYTIAIRETGALSVKRIAEGAKPKPHTILEKSIKKSSVEKYYGAQNTPAIMERLNKLNLDGFVGHWAPNGKLLGVRVDGAEQELNEKGIKFEKVEGQAIAYVPFDIENSQELENSTAPINQLKQLPKWQTLLYTGDYDLHEAYSLSQGMHGQIAEATVEKRNLLNRLNQAIARVDPTRTGEAKLEGNPARIHGEGDYAMFQHGDQATYPANQIFEALEAQGTPQGSRLQQPAKLVKAVASESNEPMAWCVRGEWYVTMNIEEHDKLRKFIGVTKPSAWNPETIAKIEKSKSKAFTFGGPPPRPRRNILDLIKLDLNKKAAQESRPIAADVSLPSSNNQDN